MKLIIKKGGILYDADEKKDITDDLPLRLFEYCELDNDVTLADIFLLINTHMDFCKLVIGNWVDEIVAEGLDNPTSKNKDIEYLELYWHFDVEYNKDIKTVAGFNFPGFGGVGFEAKEDIYDGEMLTCKKGNRVNYAVEFTPTYELLDLPVKLQNKLYITHWKKAGMEDVTWNTETFTLGHILYGIIWELSYMGGPEDRDQQREELIDRVEEAKNGEAQGKKYDSVDELLDDLESKKDDNEDDE